MKKKTRPTLEVMEQLEKYLDCDCEVCQAVMVITQVVESIELMIAIGADGDWEIAAVGGRILSNFLTERHLWNEFGLTIEEAEGIVLRKAEMERRERDEDEIPF